MISIRVRLELGLRLGLASRLVLGLKLMCCADMDS